MAVEARSVDSVEVWQVHADVPDAQLADLTPLLDAREHQRAGSMRDHQARKRYIVAHAATRLVVAHHLGTPPERIRWRRGEHGRPEVADPASNLSVNLSHSGAFALIAVSCDRQVGVDVQEVCRPVDATLFAARYFSEPEARWVAMGEPVERLDRLARLWVRKEACVKAAGARLAHGLRWPVASVGDNVVVGDPTGAKEQSLVYDVRMPRGYRAAVAAVGHRRYRVFTRQWRPGGEPSSPALRRRSRGENQLTRPASTDWP
jgi:4'-phosphopantetheinyl transferase